VLHYIAVASVTTARVSLAAPDLFYSEGFRWGICESDGISGGSATTLSRRWKPRAVRWYMDLSPTNV